MTKSYKFLLYAQFFVSIYFNHYLAAEPLIGEKVTSAKHGELPSVVSLDVDSGTVIANRFCTGTLITKRHVLTAAHCLEVNKKTESYMKPSGIVITVGAFGETPGTKYKVKEWKEFKVWAAEKNITINRAAELSHDIAVVTLANDVVEDIKPAHLSNLNYKSVYGKNVVIAGWGRIHHNLKPKYVQRADAQVVNRKTCLRNLNATGNAPEMVINHFCTVARPPVSLGCGDSGGPIFVNGDEIIGVNVGVCTIFPNHPNQQNLHAAVKFYRKFIWSVINPNCMKLANVAYSLDEFYNEE